MTATSVSSSPPTTEPLRTRPSAKVTITLLAPSITWCVVRTWPGASRRTPEPKPRRGHGLPNGGPYAAPAVLTLTVLAPTRSTALMYAFCKSAIMETDKTSAGFVERVPTGPVTGQGPRRKMCRSMLAGRMEGASSGTAPRSTRGLSRSRTRRPPGSRSGRGSIPAGSAGTRPTPCHPRESLGPERLECFLVFIEQPRLDDLVVFDPQEEQVGLLEDAIPAGPLRGSQGGRVHVAREDVDELRVERPVGQLRKLLKVREDRLLAPMVPGDRAGSGDVPHRVLRNQLAERGDILPIERRVQTLDESRVRVLEHPHHLTLGREPESRPSPQSLRPSRSGAHSPRGRARCHSNP